MSISMNQRMKLKTCFKEYVSSSSSRTTTTQPYFITGPALWVFRIVCLLRLWYENGIYNINFKNVNFTQVKHITMFVWKDHIHMHKHWMFQIKYVKFSYLKILMAQINNLGPQELQKIDEDDGVWYHDLSWVKLY